MASVRKLEVQFIGDTSSLERAFKRTDDAAGKWKGKLVTGAKVAGAGVAAGVGLGVVALKSFVDAAKDSEASNARMRAQLKASGISYGKHAKEIERVIQKHSQLSGLDDEDLQDSFTNIVRVTGDVNKALKLNAIAADFARAKHMDVAKAGELVGKVAGGNTGILSRYGIQIDKGASSTEALGLLQRKFAGQAEAYGKTTAGAQDRFKVATENLKEALGARLLPIVAKITNALAGFVNGLINGTGAAGGFADRVVGVFGTVSDAVKSAVAFMSGLFSAHADDYAKVGEAAKNVGKAIVFVWNEVVLPVVKRVLPAITQIVKGAFAAISGAVKLLTSVLTGDFRGAWEAVKQIFRGGLQAALGIVRAATAPLRETAAAVGNAISGALSNAWEKVKGGVRDLRTWLGDRWGDIKAGVSGFARDVKTAVVNAFEGAVNKVIDFVNSIISVVNKIPGVDIGKVGHVGGNKSTASTSSTSGMRRVAGDPGGGMRGGGSRPRAERTSGSTGGLLDTLNPKNLIDALPSADQLGWLAGFGKEVLKQVGEWIKDKLEVVLGSHMVGWGVIDRLAKSYGLSITSTYRPGSGTFHGMLLGASGRARATDYSNSTGPTPQMMGFAMEARRRWGSNLKELFYSPMGGSIKNGAWVPGMIVGGGLGTPGNHYNHVHAAFKRGGVMGKTGWALVGEEGPELARLPSGTRVYPHRQSTSMMGRLESPTVIINVAPGMEWIRELISVEVERGTRAQARRAERGLPGRGGGVMRRA